MQKNVVVLVEDDADVRSSYALILEPLGQLMCFESAALFLKSLDSHPKRKPDLIVTDLSMPKVTGVEMLAAARNKGIDCPALMISGHVKKESAVDAVNVGVCMILEKPVGSEEIFASAEQLLMARNLDMARREIVAATHQLQELVQALRDLCVMELELKGMDDPETVIGGSPGDEMSLNEALEDVERRLTELQSYEKSLEGYHQHVIKAA